MLIGKIVSGGQTGVDRAALDAAIILGIPAGGWCPRGRLAEDGVIDGSYPLKETSSRDYEERTEMNVRDSDATLVVTTEKPSGGTSFTLACARRLAKPALVVTPRESNAIVVAEGWILENRIMTLNVAGPRESKRPGIYREAKEFLLELFSSR